MRYKSVVFSDFDGTITAEETFAGVLRRFAQIPYQEVEKRLIARELSLRDGVRQLVESIPSKLYPEILDYVASKPIRPGFSELLDFLSERQIPFVIISGGLLGAIEHRLGPLIHRIHAIHAADVNRHGEYLELISEFENGAEVVAKAQVMDGYRFDESVSIGDGLSDINMARHSTLVFARNGLKRLLEAKGIDYLPWQDFHDVRISLTQRWCPSEALFRSEFPPL